MLKYLLAALIALTPLAPVDAGWFPLAEPSATPIGNACSTASGSTITFTAQGTGGANPNRISVVSINWSDSTAAGTAKLNSMTLGGSAMTAAVVATAGTTNSNSEVWYITNPSGTTANIVATFATAVDGVTIEVYSLIGYQSVIATTTGTTSVSQSYNNKQLGIAAASRTVNVSTSLSNMTNDFSSACGAGLWGVHASQSLRGNGGTLNSSISPTSNNPKIALAVWSTAAPLVFTTLDGAVTAGSVSGGNLTYIYAGSGFGMARSTAQKNSGKWYFEVLMSVAGTTNDCVTVITAAATDNNVVNGGLSGAIVYFGGGGVVFSNDASPGLNVGTNISAGETIGVAVDLDNHKVWFRKSVGVPSTLWFNQAIGSQNPATNTGGASITNYNATTMAPAVGFASGSATGTWIANFGQSAFQLPPPTGFTAGWTQ